MSASRQRDPRVLEFFRQSGSSVGPELNGSIGHIAPIPYKMTMVLPNGIGMSLFRWFRLRRDAEHPIGAAG
jgi:hypothetical protein